MQNVRSILHSNSVKFAYVMRKRENRRQTFVREIEEPIRKFTIGVHQRPIPEQKAVKNENNNYSPSVSKTFNVSLGVYISNMNNKKVNKDAVSSVFYLDFTNTQNLESAFLKPLNNFANLQIISLSNTGLKSVPKAILNMHGHLQYIDLSHNFISEIPSKAKWSHIRGLNLKRNAFIRWPDAISQANMPKIEFIDLSYNNLYAGIPSTLKFDNLEHLGLAYCCLIKFPQVANNTLSLKSLDISGNHDLRNFSLNDIVSDSSLEYINIQGIKVKNTGNISQIPPNLVIASEGKNVQVPFPSKSLFIFK